MNPTHHNQPPSLSTTGGNKAMIAGSGPDLLHSSSSLSKRKSFGKYFRKYQRSHSSASTTSVSSTTSASSGVYVHYACPPLAIPEEYPNTTSPDGPPPTTAPMGYVCAISHAGYPYPADLPVAFPTTSAPLSYQPAGDHSYRRSQSFGHSHGHPVGRGGKYGDYFKRASGFFRSKR